jgi:hypothetical protein
MAQLVAIAVKTVAVAIWSNTTLFMSTSILIAKAVVYTAIIAAAAYGVKAMTRKPSLSLDIANEAGSKLTMTRDSVAPRRYIYGTQRVSGPLLFAHTDSKPGSDKNEYLSLIIGLAGHEVTSIGNIFFNENLAYSDAGVRQAPFNYTFEIVKMHGATNQTSSAAMQTYLPSYWTANHKLQGIAALYTRLEYDPDVYPQGYPNISCIVQGKPCLDLRNSTTSYTENPALIIYDYLRTVGVGVSEIHTASFIDAANECDELVAAPGGGTEKRYECHYSFLNSETPLRVLENMLTSCHGKLIYDGQFRLKVGSYIAPTITLNEDDLRAGIVITRSSLSEIYNAVRGVYTDGATATSSYQPADFVPVSSSYYQNTEDGGVQIYADLQLPCTIKHSAARRLAKLNLLDKRQDLVVQYPTKLIGLRLNAGDTVAIDNSRMGWTGKVFEVLSLTINPEGGVDLNLKETAAAVYDWENVDADVDRDISPNTNWGNLYSVTAPSNFAVTEHTFTGSDGTWFSTAIASWDAIGSGDIRNVEVGFKKAADSTYTNMGGVIPAGATSVASPILENAITYNFRARNIAHTGAGSVWVSASLVVTNDTTPPQTVTGLAATSGSGYNLIKWDFVDDVDIDTYNVYRNTSNNFATATFIYSGYTNNFLDYTAPISTLVYYWLKSEDIIGNTSSFAGPVTATALPGPTNGTNGTNGTDGDDAIMSLLTNEAHTVPADASGTVTSFAGADTYMKVYIGSTDDTANWTFAKNDVNLTSTLTANHATVTAISADVGYCDITGSKSGLPTQYKRFTVSKSKTGTAGSNGTNAKLVVLTSDSQTFNYDKTGSINPASITLLATGQNLGGSPSFTVVSGSATLLGSGNTRLLYPVSMSTEAISVRADWDTVSDTISIVKVRAGSDGEPGAPGTDGAPGSSGVNGINTATVYLFQRSSAGAPSAPGSSLTYTFGTGVLSGTLGSWTQTVPSGTDTLYVTTATALSQTSTDTIASGEWAAVRQMAENGTKGAMVYIYKRASSSPSLPTGTTTYTFSTAALTGLDNGWSTSVPTTDGNPLWVSAASAVSTGLTDTIGSGEWSTPAIMAEDGADGANGTSGTSGTSGTNGSGSTFSLSLTPTYYLANVGGAGNYSAGTVVNITADANAGGYNFLQWSGGWPDIGYVENANSNNTYVVMSTDISLSADYNN